MNNHEPACDLYDYSLQMSASRALVHPNKYICLCEHCHAQSTEKLQLTHTLRCCMPDKNLAKYEMLTDTMTRKRIFVGRDSFRRPWRIASFLYKNGEIMFKLYSPQSGWMYMHHDDVLTFKDFIPEKD